MLSSCIGVVMKDGALLRSSSLFIAYMGCLGWGSAYFYGWGTSFYYGFPWWIVGAGVDDVARSLFFAVIVIAIFLIGWGIGVVFFFAVKRKHSMQELNVFRLYFAVERRCCRGVPAPKGRYGLFADGCGRRSGGRVL